MCECMYVCMYVCMYLCAYHNGIIVGVNNSVVFEIR